MDHVFREALGTMKEPKGLPGLSHVECDGSNRKDDEEVGKMRMVGVMSRAKLRVVVDDLVLSSCHSDDWRQNSANEYFPVQTVLDPRIILPNFGP